MSTIYDPRLDKSISLRYLSIGILFGLLFPAITILFELHRLQLTMSWNDIVFAHKSTPCLFMIDTAPLFLGLFAWVAGINHARLKISTANLERTVQSRTTELQKFLRIIENAPITIVITDTQGTIEYVNPYFCRSTGYSAEEAIGQNPRILKSADTPIETYKDLWDTLLSGQVWHGEFVNKRKNGELYWEAVLMVPIKNDAGDITHFVAIKEDISGLKKVQKDLSDQLAFTAQVLDEIPNPIFYEDASGLLLGCNKAYEQAFGISKETLAGKSILELDYLPLTDRPVYQKEQRRVIATGETSRQYLQRRFTDNKTHEILYSLSGFRLADGSPGGLIGVIADVSDLKEKESKLEQAYRIAQEATEAKSMFLANMSHEIRTPMNAIIGMAYLALRTELTPKPRDYIEKIHNAGTSLLGIINDILDFSKTESGNLHLESIDFPLDEVIANVVNVTSGKTYEKGLELLYRVSPAVPQTLTGDPLRLGQIITNLVNNAVKFTEQGEIIIEVEQIRQSNRKVQLQISVRDTGIGMTEEQINRLFQPFTQADGSTTRKYGGTGLGLTISKKLVELMEGNIWVKSQPGVGSTFFFTVWFGVANSQEQRIIPATMANLHLLVVDDHPAAREILAEHLQAMHFRVDTAASGQESLTAIKQCDSFDPYAAVFMDWQMPHMDGIETACHIKNCPDIRHIPAIVMITAFEREDALQKTKSACLDTLLIKPVNPSLLFNTLIKLFSAGKEAKDRPYTAKAAPEKTYALAGLRILLAEDNEINQQIAIELLESQGLLVEVVGNGQEAVNKVLLPDKLPYDMVLMDVHMPVMDGFAATKIIRNRYPALPIIAMTARAMQEEKERCFAAGMNDHIPKPIDPHLLFSCFVQWASVERQPSFPQLDNAIYNKKEDTAAESLPAVPGLNMKAGLRRMAGNTTLYKKLLCQYAASQQDAAAKIRKSLYSADRLTAERIAHTLKGVSANIGAQNIETAAAAVEQALRNNQLTESVETLLADLETALRSLVKSIRTTLPSGQPLSVAQLLPPSGRCAEHLDKLQSLLMEIDSEALEYFDQIHNDIATAFSPKDFRQFEHLLRNFELEQALEKLKAMRSGG